MTPDDHSPRRLELMERMAKILPRLRKAVRDGWTCPRCGWTDLMGEKRHVCEED